MGNHHITAITIAGMTCQACQKVIEKRVSKIEGVHTVHVHVLQGTADIEANRVITPEEIAQVLQDTDYTIINN